MVNVKASTLASRVATGLPDRWSGFAANPTGSPATTRTTLPLSTNAPATIMHPKLNGKPWSTTYAVNRQPLPSGKSKKVRKG